MMALPEMLIVRGTIVHGPLVYSQLVGNAHCLRPIVSDAIGGNARCKRGNLLRRQRAQHHCRCRQCILSVALSSAALLSVASLQGDAHY